MFDARTLRTVRLLSAAVGAGMLALWVWSFVPVVRSWGDPAEDGFSYLPVFYATFVCLPIALILLVGAASPKPNNVARARIALIPSIIILLAVVIF